MANSNVPVTPGAGANIAADLVGGVEYQAVKLDLGGPGASVPASAGSSGGLKVEIANTPNVGIAGSVTVVASSPLAVSAPTNAPVGVRLSDGTSPITTLPVSGSVTAQQGTPAANASGWPVKITDGTNTAGLTSGALNVAVVQSVPTGAETDKGAFTEGTSVVAVIGGEYNDSPSAPAAGQAAAVRITPNRAEHVNLRRQDGTEIGTSANPVRVDPTGTTTQPVSGTVAVTLPSGSQAAAGVQTANYNTGGGTATTPMQGIALPGNTGPVAGGTPTAPVRIDPTGTTTQPVSGTVTANQGGAPWQVQNAPSTSGVWKAHVTYGASASDQTIYAPVGGKTVYVEGIIITPTATGALLKIYDNSNADVDMLYCGQPPLGSIVITPARPIPLSAVNNILRYATGSGAAGDIVAWGYTA